MAIVDAMGVWEDLGVVAPTLDWQVFPYFCKSANSLFRIFYTSSDNATSSAYLRAMYFDGNKYIFDQKWLRLFPKDEPEIINYPYPPDLIKDPLPSRQFQVKKNIRWRNTKVYGFYPDTNWTIQIFEKQDTLVNYPIGNSVSSNSGGGVIVGNNNPGIIPGGGI